MGFSAGHVEVVSERDVHCFSDLLGFQEFFQRLGFGVDSEGARDIWREE
jgi:hypothetical protein